MEYDVKTFPFELKASGDDGSFEGYASTFGGKPDSYGDIIQNGAFVDTIKKGGKFGKIPQLWQHDMDKPVGVWKYFAEDSKGLFVKGKISTGTTLGRDAYTLMKDGAVDSMSIGWEVYDRDFEANVSWNKERTIRTLKKIDLWEISLVTLPANPKAKITEVKSLIESAKNERELEEAFISLGMSHKASKYLVSLCKPGLKKEDVQALGLLKTLRTVNAEFLVKRILQNSDEEKSVIPFKSYSLADKGMAWDGPEQIRLADVSDLKKICTWYDSDNPDVKGSYKLPHHLSDGYKTVWRGVATAMGALMGARGGVNIPASDKKSVYNHLAKHYREFDETPPEWKE